MVCSLSNAPSAMACTTDLWRAVAAVRVAVGTPVAAVRVAVGTLRRVDVGA